MGRISDATAEASRRAEKLAPDEVLLWRSPAGWLWVAGGDISANERKALDDLVRALTQAP
jgi:hypothetical protein